MTRRTAAGALVLLFFSSTSLAEWKNLRVLPPSISKDELKAIMRAQVKALGVDCDHCHTMPNAEQDTDKKQLAREMMRMVQELNARFLRDRRNKITCATCHRGKPIPEVVAK